MVASVVRRFNHSWEERQGRVLIEKSLGQRLEMKDIGELQNFFGSNSSRDTHGDWILQSHYIEEILK